MNTKTVTAAEWKTIAEETVRVWDESAVEGQTLTLWGAWVLVAGAAAETPAGRRAAARLLGIAPA